MVGSRFYEAELSGLGKERFTGWVYVETETSEPNFASSEPNLRKT